jgi:hypothetical protein
MILSHTDDNDFDAQNFVRAHGADDILYALQTPAYYGLSEAAVLTLAAVVFRAINQYKETT